MSKLASIYNQLLHSRSGRVITALLVVLLLITADWVGHTTLFADVTSVHQTSFTELYFSDPSTLPSKLVYGTVYSANFAIANHHTITENYTYTVTVQTDDAIVRQIPVTVAVSANRVVYPTIRFSAPIPGERVQLTISLLHTNELIQWYAQS